jgi:hypothetical protein
MADRGPTERRHFVRCDSLLPHGARHLLLHPEHKPRLYARLLDQAVARAGGLLRLLERSSHTRGGVILEGQTPREISAELVDVAALSVVEHVPLLVARHEGHGDLDRAIARSVTAVGSSVESIAAHWRSQ